MPRAAAWGKDAATIQFSSDGANTPDALRTKVVNDALQVGRAMFRVGLHCGDSLLVAYLVAFKRLCTIGVTSAFDNRTMYALMLFVLIVVTAVNSLLYIWEQRLLRRRVRA